MQLTIVEMTSRPGGDTNEDRVGSHADMAWVIDGATDVLQHRLTPFPSDASWFAGTMHSYLHDIARSFDAPLASLPARIAEHMNAEFQRIKRRSPSGPEEQPSASAMIVRTSPAGLDYVALGDCALIAAAPEGSLVHVGEDANEAGDRWVVEAIEQQLQDAATPDAVPAREALWPQLLEARRGMNQPDGFGVFSITAPPACFVRHGHLPFRAGARILLASDGLMRLVDVFRTHDLARLFSDAWTRGLAALVDDLRALEEQDTLCIKAPRAKISDDASGVLLTMAAAT